MEKHTSTTNVSSVPNGNNVDTTTASLEEIARHSQMPQPNQMIPLNVDRQVSSIPRGISDNNNNSTVPAHQHVSMTTPTIHEQESTDSETTKWVYPSEQQMYNAMLKKGWANVPIDSIPIVLQIHNSINERTWNKILDWEGCNTQNTNDNNNNNSSTTSELNLVRFIGRPNDISPKAYMYSYIFQLYDPPFDRHDWYVQKHNSNHIQRYVIDYYYRNDPNDVPSTSLPIPYIDARPALDHPYALYLHGKRFLQSAFPGFTQLLRNMKKSSSPPDIPPPPSK